MLDFMVNKICLLVTRGPLYYHGSTLVPIRIHNCIQYKVFDEITYPFQNFNGGAVKNLGMDK